ncbi:MAG: hypothetical protein V5A55_15110 [Halovenus sp.]
MTGRYSDGVDLRVSALAGTAAYLLGALVVVASGRFGLHPDAGVWVRADSLGEYLVVHMGAHLPVWSGEVQIAVLGQTVVLLALLVAAGYAVTFISDDGENSVQVGGSVVLGYLGWTVLGSVYTVFTVAAITWTQLLAPAVLVGFVLPVVFGGFGGWLYSRMLESGT